jgi:hypothetical protein
VVFADGRLGSIGVRFMVNAADDLIFKPAGFEDYFAELSDSCGARAGRPIPRRSPRSRSDSRWSSTPTASRACARNTG